VGFERIFTLEIDAAAAAGELAKKTRKLWGVLPFCSGEERMGKVVAHTAHVNLHRHAAQPITF